ncbi:hypothetical protein [Stenotrophomonas sp. 59]|uniref:hypothetical protein n=1 Tax=Stenotrophomonas sp. 59 TaxID=3051120 RepID=UPI00256EC208|nr:hypothetical protein [Stenotrophomonas sp. 59]
MITDNKTLAGVQPGGRVRLGGVLPEDVAQALATVNEAANDARHAGNYKVANALVTARVTLSKQLLALSAQPSPGGQGDVGAKFEKTWREAADTFSISRAAAQHIWNAALAARQPVGEIPAGFVLVPEKFGIPAEVWEGVEFVIGGPGTGEGEAYLDSTAWVGDLLQDDGSAVYGLHLSCDECPEEGSVTLSVFTARAEVQP